MQVIFDREHSQMIMKLAHRIAFNITCDEEVSYAAALQQGLKLAHEGFKMCVKASSIAADWREHAAVMDFGPFKISTAYLSEDWRIVAHWYQFGENNVNFRLETKIGNEWYGDGVHYRVRLDARNISHDLECCALRFSVNRLFRHYADKF